MAKAVTRGRKPAMNETAKALLAATKFLGVTKAQTAYFGDGWAAATDGILTVGCKIEGDIKALPPIKLFADALPYVGKELELTMHDDGSMKLVSGSYECTIPAGVMSEFPAANPPVATLDDAFRDALTITGRIVSDTATTLVEAAIYLNGYSVLATDRICLVEAWHGNNMPQGLVIPKAFAVALAKIDRKLTSFGFDEKGFTVYFDDESFLRTQLYSAQDYPPEVVQKYGTFFEVVDAIKVPTKLYEAIEAVLPFAGENNLVYFAQGSVLAGPREDGWAADMAVPGLPDGLPCKGAYLVKYKDIITSLDLNAEQYVVMLGATDTVQFRGAIASASKPTQLQLQPQPTPEYVEGPDSWAQSTPKQPDWNTVAQALETPVTLPYTPRSRQPNMHGSPGWETTPYTLQPGETPEMFAHEAPETPVSAPTSVASPSDNGWVSPIVDMKS